MSTTHRYVALLLAVIHTVSCVPLIKAPWGNIQGVEVTGDKERKMSGYLAIPYAQPPVGNLRFEKPQPHPGPAQGEVFVADREMPACPQMPMLIGSDRPQSEDCLMLDVYVPLDPVQKTEESYAVMVFIHGGGFMVGDAYFYRPSKLVAQTQVIVITIQYRLGVLGFVTTGDDVLPGNVGLWDQTLALRWVKDNIAAFGGDPERITIFGESAGSMSVGLHMMSPQSKGLFKRGILQSGTPQGVSLFNILDAKTNFQDLSDLFECEGGSLERLNCMKQVPFDDYFKKASEYNAKSPLSNYFFPNIDGEFIPRDLVELIKDEKYMAEHGIGDLDLMIGINNKEGSLVLFLPTSMNASVDILYTADIFNMIRQSCLTIRRLSNNKIIKQAVEFFYREEEWQSNASSSLYPLVDMYGDCVLAVSCLEWAQLTSASPHSGRHYTYVMEHDFATNRNGPVQGSHHGDELSLEFDNDIVLSNDSLIVQHNKTAITPEEEPLSDKFVEMLAAFAKTGNPNPPLKDDLGEDWPEFNTETESYLSFSNTPRIVSHLGPFKRRVAFWNTYLPELNALAKNLPPEDSAEEGEPQEKEEAASKEEL